MDEYIFNLGDCLYDEGSGEVVFKPEMKEKIVRCRDCEYADDYFHCARVNWWNREDDFCSRGVKK